VAFYGMVVRQRQIQWPDQGLISIVFCPLDAPTRSRKNIAIGRISENTWSAKGLDQSELTLAQRISNGGSNLTSTSPRSVVRIIS